MRGTPARQYIHQLINLSAKTLTIAELQPIDGITNSPPKLPIAPTPLVTLQQSPTAQELVALILQCHWHKVIAT